MLRLGHVESFRSCRRARYDIRCARYCNASCTTAAGHGLRLCFVAATAIALDAGPRREYAVAQQGVRS